MLVKLNGTFSYFKIRKRGVFALQTTAPITFCLICRTFQKLWCFAKIALVTVRNQAMSCHHSVISLKISFRRGIWERINENKQNTENNYIYINMFFADK